MNQSVPSLSIHHDAIDKIPWYTRRASNIDFRRIASSARISFRGGSKLYQIGDKIILDIQLYTESEFRIREGGDILRIWMVGYKSHVAGYVIDNGNGSYQGVLNALWVGRVTVFITIANVKEHVSFYLKYLEKHGTFFYTNASFTNLKKRNTNEVMTFCTSSAKTITPLYKEVCNFTSQNNNISFYCGKPNAYSCSNWRYFGWTRSFQFGIEQETKLA